ncbi:MAG: thioredoxin-like domain-containing protein [Cyclobacteriaceae bacterium]
MKRLWIWMFFFTYAGYGQNGYRIELTVKGLKDTTAYLGYYYGESTYINDTSRVDAGGKMIFDGSRTLPQGVYYLVLNKTRIFEFVIGKDQQFALSTDQTDYVKNMKVTGDEDNRLFFENMMFNAARNRDAEPHMLIIRDSLATADKKTAAQEHIKKINDQVKTWQDALIGKNPGLLTSRILKATRQMVIPDPPKKEDGSVDSAFQFKYYRKHFWDDFDLADDALIRLPRPLFQEKIREYFTRLVPPVADSVSAEIDRLALMTKKNQETYKYFIWMNVIEFQQPRVMGLDGVFVHLIRKYFNSGEMDFWINAKMKTTLKERADQMGLSLMGMNAPNLTMQDKDLRVQDLHSVVSKKRYTILFIFDPDCGHCREETPKLVNFYNSYKSKFDLEVFAVSADSSMKKMRDFITEFKMPWITVNASRSYTGNYHKLYDADVTPTIYIIDNRKKIIAKKPPIEEFVNFFNNQEKLARQNGTSKPPGR